MPYTYSHLEDFIRKTYRDLNIHSPAELNIYRIADTLGIGLYPISTSSQALQFDGRYYIFLNNTLTPPERFETFGHELGHILLHTGNQKTMNENYRVYQEWKANLFTMHFCVPTFMLQQLPTHHLNEQTISEVFGVTLNFANKRLSLHHQKILDYQSMRKLQVIMENYR